jgi:hypothetical protein
MVKTNNSLSIEKEYYIEFLYNISRFLIEFIKKLIINLKKD